MAIETQTRAARDILAAQLITLAQLNTLVATLPAAMVAGSAGATNMPALHAVRALRNMGRTRHSAADVRRILRTMPEGRNADTIQRETLMVDRARADTAITTCDLAATTVGTHIEVVRHIAVHMMRRAVRVAADLRRLAADRRGDGTDAKVTPVRHTHTEVSPDAVHRVPCGVDPVRVVPALGANMARKRRIADKPVAARADVALMIFIVDPPVPAAVVDGDAARRTAIVARR
jgi:hypothetical protein